VSATEPTPWQVLSKRIIHESPWGINVALWSVRLPDGTIARDHPVLEHLRPVVGIVPIADDGRILMIDHYRVITGQRGWELPAGRVDAGESLDEAARRELLRALAHRVVLGPHDRRVGRARLGPQETAVVLDLWSTRRDSSAGRRWRSPSSGRAIGGRRSCRRHWPR
jgi:hypothetical protein